MERWKSRRSPTLPPRVAGPALALTLAALAPPLGAQDAADDGAGDSDDKGTAGELEPIRVEGEAESATGPVDGYRAERSATATRTDRAIQDTPASVQVVPRDVIEDQQSFDLREVLQNVSGVTSDAGSALTESRESVFTRGFRSRAVYYDGFRAEALPGFDLANVERVEVLKGPASIVAGQIEPGGLVNIVPKRPGREPEGQIGVEVGEFSFRRATVDLTGTAGEGAIGGRLVGSITDSDSFRDFVETERETVMPSFRADLGDRGEVELELLHYDEETLFDEGVAFGADGSEAGDISTFLGGPDLDGSDFDWNGLRLKGEFDASASVTLRAGLFYQDFEHDWEAFRPLADPGEEPASNSALAHAAGVPLNAIPADPVADDEIFRFYDNASNEVETTELRLEALTDFDVGSWGHQVLVGINLRELEREIEETRGLDFFDPDTGEFLPQRININTPQHGDDVPTQRVEDGRLDGEQDEIGVFVQDSVVGGRDDQWNVLAGLRYDEVEQETLTDRAQDALQDPAGRRDVVRTDKTDDEVTGRLGFLYRFNPGLATFASFSQSFSPSGTKVSGDSDELLDATTGEQFEVGLKFGLLGGALTGTASAFRINREDVPIIDPDDRTRFVNGGDQTSEGVEVDLAGKITDDVQMLASVGFLDARTEDSTGFGIDDGSPLRGVPDYTASLTTRWRIPGGPLQGFRLSGTAFSADDRPGDDQNSFELDGFTTLRLGLARDWRIGGQVLTTRLGVKNLTDEEYFVASNSKSSFVPGEPRTIRFALDWKF